MIASKQTYGGEDEMGGAEGREVIVGGVAAIVTVDTYTVVISMMRRILRLAVTETRTVRAHAQRNDGEDSDE